MEDYSKKVEAILFAAGRFVTADELCTILGITNKDLIHHAIKTLYERMQEDQSPLLLLEEKDSWKLSVGEQYQPIVSQVLPETELTKSELETLAVVAWKQPIFQSEVIAVRTNKAYKHIDELEEMGFITRTKSGKTYQLKLTQKFFEYFNITDHAELRNALEEKVSPHTVSDSIFEGPYAGNNVSGKEVDEIGSQPISIKSPETQTTQPGMQENDEHSKRTHSIEKEQLDALRAGFEHIKAVIDNEEIETPSSEQEKSENKEHSDDELIIEEMTTTQKKENI